MKGLVLIVDDHVRYRNVLAAELEEEGFRVVQAGNGEEAWTQFCDVGPDVVLTDLVMPGCTGHDLLKRIRDKSDVPVILFTAHGGMEAAVAAIKAGADEFVSSADMEIGDLVDLVHTAVSSMKSNLALPDLDRRIAGSSRTMMRVRSRMMGLAPLYTPVLVIGESGTGKDAVIHSLHELGSSGRGDMVTVECETFSPEQGMPQCTAVYLDSVERLSPPAQDYWARRLGEYEKRQFRDAPRIFASSHPRFRFSSQHPYHGYLRSLLMRFPLELPPLSERPEDVPEIASVLVARIAKRMERPTDVTASAGEFLAGQIWPRNISQLEQLLERAVAFSRDRKIRKELLAELINDFGDSLESIRKHHVMRERDQLIDALQVTGGNVSQTAENLGKSRGSIYRLIEKHGISLTTER